MIYSKLCSSALKSSKDNLLSYQKCLGILNQNCLFYSHSILSKLNEDKLLNNSTNRDHNKQILNFLNNRRLLYLKSNSTINKQNAIFNNNHNNLPVIYKDLPKSLSTETDSSLEFKKINTSGDLSLIKPKSPIELVLPSSFLPYVDLLRLNKFTGTMFLLYPCLWSIGLGGIHGELPNFMLMGEFIAGAVLMRSAGCIVNDLMDKNFDKQVDRTKSRPLASGKLNEFEAFAALAACLTGSLHILLSFDPLTILYGASSLFLVTLYPLMKRMTNWPQLFLGFTFNWGAILGWSAIQNGLIDWSVVLPLYAAGVFWTLIYDTIYAYQDYHQDKKLGLKSTTMVFGEKPKPWLASFAVGMNSCFLLTGLLSDQMYPFYLGVGLSAIHMSFIIRNLNPNDPNSCANQFKHCQFIGYYMLMGIILSVLFDTKNKPKKVEVDINLRDDRALI